MIPQQKRGRSPAPSPDTSAEEDEENTTDSPVPRRPSTAKRQRTDAGPPLDIAAPDFDQGKLLNYMIFWNVIKMSNFNYYHIWQDYTLTWVILSVHKVGCEST